MIVRATEVVRHKPLGKTELLRIAEQHEAVRQQVAELDALVEEVAGGAAFVARDKALDLVADQAWEPAHEDLVRGRQAQLEAFQRAENLPLPQYVALAGKSRQQVYKDIDAGRLIALDVGTRGRRIPVWQLDANVRKMVQYVRQAAPEVDAWTLYDVLTAPSPALGDRSPVAAAAGGDAEGVAEKVCALLGIQLPGSA